MLRNHAKACKDIFYVTTPIYYVNASPHIGHLYSSVLADAIQRWQRVLNSHREIRLATGTDEHGTKVQQAANKQNIGLNDYCANIFSKYKNLADLFNVGYTDFVRTTEERHNRAVHHFWNTIEGNGHIYTDKYEGWYCIPDETFLTESQLKEIDKNGKKEIVSIESGHPVEWVEEQNYMFRLSAVQENLEYWLTKNESVIKPRKFQKILLDLISKGTLPDVSISRPVSRVHWGIPVPGDDTQTVYVWLDALVNYLTVAGYPSSKDESFRNVWPPDVQVIGKDILKFHGVYWPAFLMAANLDPPKSIFCHSHWTVDGEKMSKSKKNVVCPFDRSEIYTSEGLRYFLLREGVAHSDGNYSDTKVLRILNSELADTLGNLLSRCTGISLNPDQVFPEIDPVSYNRLISLDVTKNLMESVRTLPDVCKGHYEEHNFYKAVDAVIFTLHKANLFFETLKPWELKKDESKEKDLEAVLHITLETLRISGVLLQPIIPNLSKMLLDTIRVPEEQRFFHNLSEISWDSPNFTRRCLDKKDVLFKRIKLEVNKRNAI